MQWTSIGATGKLGPVILEADGSFEVFGMTFSQGSSFENTWFGDARFDKQPGNGQTLTITAPDAVHELSFDNDEWWYRKAKSRMCLRTKAIFAAACIAIVVIVGAWLRG